VVEGVTDRIKGGSRSNEISRDQLGSLVNELVERVLTIGSSSTPDDRASLVINTLTTLCNELAVRLHVSLLEVIGELVKVLVIGEKQLGLSAVKIVVPDTEDGQDDREVLLQGSLPEVLIHAVSTLEKLLKVIISDNESDRQPDSTPKGVPSTDPIPELEHVLLRYTKGGHRLGVRTEGDEMFGDVSLIFGGLEEPVSSTLSIGDCFLSSEGFAGNDEERSLGVTNPQSLGEVGSVDVRNEVGREVPLGVGLESFGNHDGAQVGTTDTDVDNSVNALSRVSLPSSVPNGLGELLDVLKHS